MAALPVLRDPGSKHWWVEAVDADRPEALADGARTVVLPGAASVAVKDPVVVVDENGAGTCGSASTPSPSAGHEDRMSTAYATSDDGLAWDPARDRAVTAARHLGRARRPGHRTVLVPRAARRPVRRTAARAEDNWHEQTGLARVGRTGGASPRWTAAPSGSPHSDGALRYATALRLPDGGPGSTPRWPVPTAPTTW